MAKSELQKLKRRELLKMLLLQCQETERLEKELSEITAEYETMAESYGRLKEKLNVKDARLNQKDARIRELQNEIEEMKASRVIELEDAGSIAEAALRLNGVFEAAQKAAEQYLMNVKRLGDTSPDILNATLDAREKRIPTETGRRSGIRRKSGIHHGRQGAAGVSLINMGAGRNAEPGTDDKNGQRILAAVSGGVDG